MELRALLVFALSTKSSAYLKGELSQSCVERGFDVTFNSTPDTCYRRQSASGPVAWSASWTLCSSLGSGDGLKAHTLQPRSAEVQDALLDRQPTAAVWTNVGLTFAPNGIGGCLLYVADYFGRPPAWLSLTELSFPGIWPVTQQIGSSPRRSILERAKQGGRWLSVVSCPSSSGVFFGRFPSDATDGYFINHIHYNPPQHVLVCQLQAFSSGSGMLVRQAARAAADKDQHRIGAFAAPSLAACSLACLRTGLCFGLGFGGGRCELYSRAAAEMEGAGAGWGPNAEGLYFYAFHWPIRR